MDGDRRNYIRQRREERESLNQVMSEFITKSGKKTFYNFLQSVIFPLLIPVLISENRRNFMFLIFLSSSN